MSHELKATRSAGPSPEQKCRPVVKEPEGGATLPKSALLRWRAHEAHSGGRRETREIRKGGQEGGGGGKWMLVWCFPNANSFNTQTTL